MYFHSPERDSVSLDHPTEMQKLLNFSIYGK